MTIIPKTGARRLFLFKNGTWASRRSRFASVFLLISSLSHVPPTHGRGCLRGCEEDFGSWPRPAWGVPGLLIVTFLAILLVFISPGRSHSIFLRSWLDFPSLLASLNPSKSTKNRSQEAIHLGLQFLIDFWLIFMFNFHAPNLQNHGFFLEKRGFG